MYLLVSENCEAMVMNVFMMGQADLLVLCVSRKVDILASCYTFILLWRMPTNKDKFGPFGSGSQRTPPDTKNK
jgi:hypothetical protein